MSDRTVHAEHPEGEQIVRYERAGKWYIELVEPSTHAGSRQFVHLDGAVARAVFLEERGGRINWDLPGGTSFYARVRRLKKS